MGFGHRNPDRILGGRDFSLINPGRRGLGVLTLSVCGGGGGGGRMWITKAMPSNDFLFRIPC